MARKDIRPGRRRYRATLERVALTPDGQGGQSETWSTLAEVWARAENLTTAERLQAEQLQSRVSHRIIISWQSDPGNSQQPIVSAGDRCVYRGRIFNIKAVVDVEDKRRWIQLDCESGAAP